MRVLVVDDEPFIRESIQRLFELEGIESAAAGDGEAGRKILLEQPFDAVILDLKMQGMSGQELLEWIRSEGPRTPVIMISAFGEIADAVAALKSGASDYLIKPFDPTELMLKVREIVSNRRRQDLIEAGRRTAEGPQRIVGESPSMRALRQQVAKVAAVDTTALITGESGTGKEVVAREIHALSPHAEEPFIAVNIGGIHEQLIESELFGHEKGAFTGAETRKPGLFEIAGNGILFLDEIGEMPLALQVKLLRVLQERKIRRLGGTRDIPVEARILSATNRDIEALVREGRFREDLFYRLNVVRIEVPPLRERPQDIPLLAGHLLEKVRRRLRRSPMHLAPEAVERLVGYPFPGNVRELENILERAVIYSEGAEIRAADLDLRDAALATLQFHPRRDKHSPLPRVPQQPPRPPMPAGASSSGAASHLRAATSPDGSLDELERAAIVRALERYNGNRTKAAEDLGISRRTIMYKIKRYGIQ